MFIYFCIPFFLISAFHLVSVFLKNEKVKDISKVVLMPVLALTLLIYHFVVGNSLLVTLLLFVALLFSAVGDFFLLKQEDDKRFLKGLCSFAFAHIFYLILIAQRYTLKPSKVSIVLIAIPIYCLIAALAYFFLRRPKGLIGFAAMAYTLLLLLVNYTALHPIIENAIFGKGLSDLAASYVLAFAGNVVFFVSDSFVSQTKFVKDFRGSRFIIMITYIAAQFMLIWSLVM